MKKRRLRVRSTREDRDWDIKQVNQPVYQATPLSRYPSTILEASRVLPVIKNPPAYAGDARAMGSIFPGMGRSPGEGSGNPVQYSCLGNPMDRGAWWATVHGGHRETDTTEHTHHHHQQQCLKNCKFLKSLNPWRSTGLNIMHQN